MITARYGHALILVNNLIYTFGGDENKSCEVYSCFAENRWDDLDPLPITPGATVAALYKSEIWVTGHTATTISAFNPATRQHRVVNVALPPTKTDRIMIVYGSNLYVATS